MIDKNTLPNLVAAAKPGDVITLAPGTYPASAIKVKTFNPPIVIKGGPGVVLQGILMQLCDGIGFDGLEVTVDPAQGAAIKGGCTNCTVTGCNIHGAAVGDGVGVSLINSSGARVLGNDVHHLGAGLAFSHCDNVTVSDNRVHDIRIDGVDVLAGSKITVANNQFTDFYPLAGDHSDAIQFVTTNTVGPQTDILIAGNAYVRGKGLAMTQGIFMGNEAKVDYQRVVIRDNEILGSTWHGILVVHADVALENNVVAGYNDAGSKVTPWIKADTCTGHASGNTATGFIVTNSPAFVDGGNTAIAPIAPADHYTPPVDWPAVVADLKDQLAAMTARDLAAEAKLAGDEATLAAIRADLA